MQVRQLARSTSGLGASIAAPVRALRRAHLPILAIYGSSGALLVTAVAESFWVKGALSLSAADLASIAIWLQLPWIAKMIVSEIVDAAPRALADRRLLIGLGAAITALGLVMLAAAAGKWITVWPAERLYVVAQLIVVLGGVLQEVVADTLVPGVVPRIDADSRPRPAADINAELAMVEVLARLVYTAAAFVAGGLAGVLAAAYPAEQVFLMALVVPALSVLGALFAPVERAVGRAVDPRIFGGGVALTLAATTLGLAEVEFAQEIIFITALAVLSSLLAHLLRHVTAAVRRQIVTVAILVFAFRAIPSVGDGYRWYAIDRLGFDEVMFGVLQSTGTAVGFVLMWLLARPVAEWAIERIIWLLTAVAVVLLLPTLVLANGWHAWTLAHLGLGPRQIAIIDEAAQSPLALLATVPLLALIAVHAPRESRATWFAVTASLMSLAIVAGQLITKYLNWALPIARGEYQNVPAMVGAVVAISIALPLATLALLRRRVEPVQT
jgi:hypothetical protein